MIPEINYNPDAAEVRRQWVGRESFNPRTAVSGLTMTQGWGFGFAVAIVAAVAAGAALVWVFI